MFQTPFGAGDAQPLAMEEPRTPGDNLETGYHYRSAPVS
jgi:hypothetical protein